MFRITTQYIITANSKVTYTHEHDWHIYTDTPNAINWIIIALLILIGWITI